MRGRRVDNNNYYTRRSFANAVLRGWLGEGGKVGRSADGVGAGNGRPLYLARSQAGEAEERMNRRGARGRGGGGGERFLNGIVMRVFPVCSLPSLCPCPLYDCLVLLTPSISCSSLIPHSLCVTYILGRSFHPLDLSSAPPQPPLRCTQ